MPQTPTSSTPPSSSGNGRASTASTIPAEVTTAGEIIAAMKGSLGNLGSTFDSLGDQIMQMVQLGSELEAAPHINSVRKELEEQEEKHEKQIEEVKALLKDVLQNDIVEHLRDIIQRGISSQIDKLVEEQVAEQLPNYIPKELQEELAAHMRELEEVERALHNSESRRLNAQLRTNRMQDALYSIYKTDGTVSALFPKTLESLFSMDDETAKILMREYSIGYISDFRERNINRFVQFCGVDYQLVRSPHSPF